MSQTLCVSFTLERDRLVTQPHTRQQLYDRIRATSRDEVILEEMIRLGFWPAHGTLPEDPADEIRRQGEVQRELDTLRAESRRLHHEAALLKALRQRRFAEARRKRQETKERHERERQERATAWRQHTEREIVFLGPGVSGGLNTTEGNTARLQSAGLPVLTTAAELATAMSITVGELRFLAFARNVATVSHYVRFAIPKKTGGMRQISAPMPRLKAAQHWILHHILAHVPPHDAAHGFRPQHSIVSNAQPHVGADIVLNVDLQDFFPSIAYPRVKGVFRALGYADAVATILGLVCTAPDIEELILDGQTYFVAVSERHLPQGAPSSPALTNLLCRRLDRRLTALAARNGFTYTRYADDLTFSASGEAVARLPHVHKRLAVIIAAEGLTLHPRKTRLLRRGRQQEVTGLVVNSKVNIARATLKRFRAVLYQIEEDGPEGKRWGHSSDVIAAVRGFAHFVAMVNPEKGALFQDQVRRIIATHGWSPPQAPLRVSAPEARPASVPVDTAPAAPESPAITPWWKLW